MDTSKSLTINLAEAKQYAISARVLHDEFVDSGRSHHAGDSKQAADMAMIYAAIAQAEALQRIADVLENFSRNGVPVVDASQESYASLAETIAAQHDAGLYQR